MLNVGELAAGVSATAAAGAMVLLVTRRLNEQSDVDGALLDRIQRARSTSAPAYQEVTQPVRQLSPEEEDARQERRQRELALSRAMLDEVSERLEDGLQEALLNDDDEMIAEYREELGRLRPLPGNVALVGEEADYKRWIDPENLRG